MLSSIRQVLYPGRISNSLVAERLKLPLQAGKLAYGLPRALRCAVIATLKSNLSRSAYSGKLLLQGGNLAQGLKFMIVAERLFWHASMQGGKLAEGLLRALRRAVRLNRVPDDLKPDLLFLAQLLDPLVASAKAAAPDLPAKARAAAKKIHENEAQAYEVSSIIHPGKS